MKKLLKEIKLIGNNRKQMEYKIYSNITCPNKRFHGKYWGRFSLLRNLFNIKHHAP